MRGLFANRYGLDIVEFAFGWFWSFFELFVTSIVSETFDASTYWDLATDNHVLLQALEVVDATRDSARDKYASRILEGCGRQERVGVDGDLGDTEEHLSEFGWLLAFGEDASVLFRGSGAADDIASYEAGVARFVNHHAGEHLANDNFEMLGGDFVTLSGVNRKDIVQDVALGFFDALVLHEKRNPLVRKP